jgi:hypothetical protein
MKEQVVTRLASRVHSLASDRMVSRFTLLFVDFHLRLCTTLFSIYLNYFAAAAVWWMACVVSDIYIERYCYHDLIEGKIMAEGIIVRILNMYVKIMYVCLYVSMYQCLIILMQTMAKPSQANRRAS